MKQLFLVICIGLVGVQGSLAQSPTHLVPAGGVVHDTGGAIRTGSVVVTFAIYADRDGGVPLWSETQALELDAAGQYSTLIGQTHVDGLPVKLFSGNEARWLGVAVDGGAEEPRSFLASVPYSLKAADAETVGGLPPSAFILNPKYRSTASPLPGDRSPGQPSVDGDGVGAATQPALLPSLQTIAEDLVVQGSGCFGLDCTTGEVFGFDTLRLKENNLRIKFEDTSVSAGFPSNDWQLTINDSLTGGLNKFSIEDVTGATVPLTILAGAPTNSLFLDGVGRLGLHTATPLLDVHVATGNTPAFRMEQTSGGGYTAQSWDIGANEANFFVRDLTGGSKLPLRVRPGAPTSSLDIAANGNVGIGTAAPGAALDVVRTAGSFANMMQLTNNAGLGLILNNTTANKVYLSVNSPGTLFTVNFDDGDGPELAISPSGALSGVTSCTGCAAPSDRNLKENFASIDRDAVLKGLLGLDVNTWNYKAISPEQRHIGPVSQDFYAAFAVGQDVTLSPVDTFGVTTAAIQALTGQISDLRRLVDDLEAQIKQLRESR
jgi:hypothetical protein